MLGVGAVARRAHLGDGLAALVLGAAAALTMWLTASSARLLLQLGPNDTEYVSGFRPGGWERDGETRYHWTTHSSLVRLPVRLTGEGFLVRARVRRHMVEPAQVTVRVEGRAVHSFSIAADTKIAYRIVEFPLPRLDGRHPLAVSIESSSTDPRPLGVALDWLQIDARGTGRVRPLPGLLLLAAVLAMIAYAAPRVAGLPSALSAIHGVSVVIFMALASATDLLAADRILRDGFAAYVFVGFACAALGAWLHHRSGAARTVTGLLAAVVLLAVGLRLALVLHPRFYYPDVKAHAVVAYVLSKEGLSTFLERYAQTQFRFSLGLQFQSGHWYAFPYAPGLYFLCWPLITIFQVRPEVAVSSVAAVFNSLGIVLTFVLARYLLQSEQGALLTAVAHAVLPLYLVRLTMAYFPAVTGHVIDAAALTFLLLRLKGRASPAAWCALGVLLTLSLLVYSQALINIGLLASMYLLLDTWKARAPEDRRRQLALAVTVALAMGLALLLFYKRYVPVFLDMRHGVPMAEEEILLDKQRVERSYAESRGEALPVGEEPDPYSGPGFGPLRGIHRVAARLFIFYGPFALTVLWGLYAVIVQRAGTERRYLAVWGALFFVICFLAGALPSPNFLRYSKDLEASAPLFLVGFAWTTLALARRSRTLAILHVVGFVVMGLWRGLEMWSRTFEHTP